jgi:hypothetical protein
VNGYAYVWNNPMTLTDPTGFEVSADDIKKQWEDAGGGRIEEVVTSASRLRLYLGSLAREYNGRLSDLTTALGPSTTEFAETGAGGGTAGDGSGGENEPLSREQRPPCEGGAPQLVDANLTAAVAAARTAAANATGSSPPVVGSRGADAVTSARIAPYERIAANVDWPSAYRAAARLGTALNFYNVVSGFRSSVADGLYATADVAVGTGLVLAVPYAGVPVSIAYSAHGGSKALVNDVGYMTGQCRAQ